MRRYLLLIVIQLIFMGFLQAQYSPYDTMTYVFKLETEDARILFQDQEHLQEPYFHTLVDSFPYSRNTLEPQSYPNGHYLLARATGEEVNVTFKSVNTISAVVLPNKRDLLIQVYDSLGQALRNASVSIGNQKIPFKAKKGGYFKSKWKKEGLVEISAAGETLFYKLEKKNQQWKLFKARYQYFSQGKMGRIVTSPIRWGKGIFYYVRGAVMHRQFVPPFVYRLRDIPYKWENKFPYKGYTAVQQPIYQPKDTVKVKAYITNHRGKPLKKGFRLRLNGRNARNRPYFDIPIEPDQNGNYTYEFALGDSLKLDQTYNLTFYSKKKGYRKNNFTQQFRYEDYQLDEVTWSFKTSKDFYNYGESVILFAEGKDANGNTIPDGQIRLKILAGSVDKHFENPSYIPDTIWQWESTLRTQGQTQIIVPDSLLPNANILLTAKAELVNANGEIHNQSKAFRISRNRERIKTEIKNGFVYANYYKDGKKIDTTGTLDYWLYDEVDIFMEERINFPFKRRINPYVMDYDFRVNKVYKSISLEERTGDAAKSGVSINGTWKNKVAQFQLANPHEIPVYYTIRTRDRVLFRDSSARSEIIFSKSKYQGAYYINYSYVWGGQTHESSSELRPYKKQLQIKVNQAPKVRPGDLVSTEIEVLNYKGKAAKGVNLTAGAINTQFKRANNFNAPQITYKRKRLPFEYTNFLLKRAEMTPKQLPMSPFFYDKMKLEDHFFFQIRYDNPNRITLQYDSLAAPKFADLAQVAPYLLKDGKEIPAEMIYINAKLVYYAGTTLKQPYSFLGFDGKNSITIRTRMTEYKFKDIPLKKGHKLEMLVNLDGALDNSFKSSYSVRAAKESLSLQEKKILNLTLFQYSGRPRYASKEYIWQDEGAVFEVATYGRGMHHIIGPLTASQPIGLVVQNQFIRNFVNIPGYRFELFPTQERLYANQLFDINKNVSLPKRKGFNEMGQLVNTTADIITQTPKQKKIYFGIPNFKNKNDSGRYQFKIPRDKSLTAVIITNAQDNLISILKPHTRKLEGVKAGKYHLYLFTENGYYTKHPFTIKAAHLLHEDLANIKYQQDSLDQLLLNFTDFTAPIPERKMDDYTAQFFKKKKQGIIGKINRPNPDSTQQIFNLRLLKDDLLVAQTQTDTSGYYELICYPGIYQLIIQNQSDKSAFEFPVFVTDSSLVRLDLTYFEKAFYLNHVEIIGYRAPLIEKDMTTSGTIITSEQIKNLPTKNINALTGRVGGVLIEGDGNNLSVRGSRSASTDYYIDGVPFRGNMIPQSEINQMQFNSGIAVSGTVTDTDGEALIGCSVVLKVNGNVVAGTITDIDGNYTIQVPNGAFELEINYVGYSSQIIQATSNDQYIDVELDEGGVSLDEVVVVGYSGRSQSGKSPLNIETQSLADAPPPLEGGMQIRSDFKDYAYWQPHLITDKKGKASFQTIFPDKLTSWRTYVIGMDKKLRAGVAYANTQSFKPLVAQLAIPRFLIAGDESIIIGKSVNYTQDTYPIKTQFLQEGEVLFSNTADIKDALIETTEINAPLDVDSLSINYQLETGDYGDGEQRQIPIFPNGIEESIGGFHLLEGDTILQLAFDPQKGPITLYTQSDVLNLMLEDLDYLHKYPYGCNEQTASRLMALLLEKQVRQQLNQPFENEDALIKMIVHLKKNQNEDGSWGWWYNNAKSHWITLHVLKSLAKANEAGYTTTAFDKGIRYVTNFMPTTTPKQQLEILELFSDINQQTNYEKYLSNLDSLKLGLSEQFTIIKIKQEQNLTYQLDSLETHRRTTLFGGNFWGNKSGDIMSKDVALSLLAYQIYRNAGKQNRINSIRQFFMMRRSKLSDTYGRRLGRNTYETAKILATLLPDFLSQNDNQILTENKIILTGNTSETITQFPFKRNLTGASTLQIQKTGTGILFLTAYQEFLNSNPTAKRDLFDIKTQLVQKGKTLKVIKQGERIQLVVDVKVAKDTEYAMIEIPIPAACSYSTKPNLHHGVEVHREYFRNKTAIFCQNLPEGEHQFTIDLEVRFSGAYSLLPAKVEQMYFPIFYGRNETKQVSSRTE